MAGFGCNRTHETENIQSDDDQISAAQMMGFGSGANLSAYHFFFGFSLSMILGAIGEGLDVIETITHGTAYHLMLQRIYRQLMLIGLISFGLSFISLGGTPFPTGIMDGFNFGDYTLFITAIYFCLQGLWVMFSSVGLANAWDRASKITTEELQIDVERSNNLSLWKMMFYPFNVTRNQVEFRIFQSIFTSSYSISTKHNELDFGLYLKMTHENNLMNIIDFNTWKGCLILILIGLASVKVQFYHSSCSTPVCEAEEEIWIFTCGGVVILILSGLLFYWGRRSEMLLIQKSGLESIDDYPVFLMVESQMQKQFEKTVLKTSNVKSAINELMVEAESTKLEIESKKRKILNARLKQTARLIVNVNSTTRPHFGSTDRQSGDQEESGEHSDSEVKPFHLPSLSDDHKSSYLSPSSSANPLHLQLQSSSLQGSQSPTGILHSGFSTRRSSGGGGGGGGGDLYRDNSMTTLGNRLISIPSKVLCQLNPMTYFKKSITVVPVRDLEANHLSPSLPPHPSLPSHPPPPLPSIKTNHSHYSSSSIIAESKSDNQHPHLLRHSQWKKTKQLLRKLSSGEEQKEIDNISEKKKIKIKIKTNFHQQKFPDIFVFQNPVIFYFLLHAVMTCNSLYLALWTTNFAIIAYRGNQKEHSVMLMILSILPALFALPFVSQAIKSSSILKGVTKINLDVITAVVEKTELTIHLLQLFRSNLIHYLHQNNQRDERNDQRNESNDERNDERNDQRNGERNDQRNDERNGERNDQRNERNGERNDERSERNDERNGERNDQRNGESNEKEMIHRVAVNQLYEMFNHNFDGLTYEEFLDLIEGCHLHVPKHQTKLIYGEMDINHDGAITMEEFERFLFPEETLANDKKKQKFFESQNKKSLGTMGKHASAKRIMNFLDPHLISKM